MVTVPLEMLQTPDAVIVTVRPEVDVALAAKVVLYAAGEAGAGNVIVWAVSAAVTVRTTLVAALYVALPACDAVSAQVPVPLVMVTVPFEMLQTPVAAIVTVRPEVDVALTAKVVL